MGKIVKPTDVVLLMSQAILGHMATQLLWLILLLCTPVVLVVAIVSLMISLFQTLTQLQDQSLQFIFKLVAASLTLFMTYHWMGESLMNYSDMAFRQLTAMRY